MSIRVGLSLVAPLYYQLLLFSECLLMCYVTVKSKSLTGTANYLLALTSFFELLHQPGHFLFLFLSLSGQNFIDYRLAIRICSLPLFGIFANTTTLLFIGLDRLLGIIFLNFYKTVKYVPYLGAIFAIIASYGLYADLVLNEATETMSGLKITGFIGDLYQGQAGKFLNTLALAFNVVTIAVYGLTGVIIYFRSTLTSDVNRRIFRSLCFIISISIGGYFLMAIFLTFIVPKIDSPILICWFGTQIFAIPLNISSASNGPILYFTSSEYRKVFRAEWKKLRMALFKVQNLTINTNSVQPIHSINVRLSNNS